MRRDHFRAELLQHLRVEPLTVISSVADKPLWYLGDEALLYGLGHQLYFSRASTLRSDGEMKTMAVGYSHPVPHDPLAGWRWPESIVLRSGSSISNYTSIGSGQILIY